MAKNRLVGILVVAFALALLFVMQRHRSKPQEPPAEQTAEARTSAETMSSGASPCSMEGGRVGAQSGGVARPDAGPAADSDTPADAADALYRVLGELVGDRPVAQKASGPTSGQEEARKDETKAKSQQEEETGPGEITAEVTWADGKRAVGVFIEVTRGDFDANDLPGPSVLRFTSSTDASGRFAVSGLPLARYLVRAVMPDAQALRTCDLQRSARMHIQMELEGTGAIAGTVVDAEGAPIPGAKVFPHFSESENRTMRLDWGSVLAAVADGQGQFCVDHLWSSGRWQLLARASGFALTITDLVPVGTENVRIVLHKGSGILYGIAVDSPSRRPVPSVPDAGEVELVEGQQLTGIVLVVEPPQESHEFQ